MRPANLVRYGMLLLLLALMLAPAPSQAAPLGQTGSIFITYPTEGLTLSGTVPIQGSATHPAFVSYGVLYASGERVTGDTQWRQDNPIAWNVTNQVVNGTLASWDTTQVPNGRYVLALVVFESGSDTPNVFFVTNLTVFNQETTPTPEATETPEAEEEFPPLDPEQPVGEFVPPVTEIEQPPTATPRPAPTLVPGAAPIVEEEDDGLDLSSIVSMDAVREAFVLGAQLAFLLYALGILYFLGKAAVRYYLRQQHRKGPSS